MGVNMNMINKTAFLLLSVILGISYTAMSDPGALNKSGHDNKEVMERLSTYIGQWKSDIKTTQNDEEFYYIYEFKYFDESKSIFKMVITRHQKDGGDTILAWEGYKGWNSVKEEFYYYGFSPSGRFSVGVISIDEEKLVTKYTGYGPDGVPVQIVDEFFSVEKGMFKSVTNLKPEGGEWRVIGRDEWTKM